MYIFTVHLVIHFSLKAYLLILGYFFLFAVTYTCWYLWRCGVPHEVHSLTLTSVYPKKTSLSTQTAVSMPSKGWFKAKNYPHTTVTYADTHVRRDTVNISPFSALPSFDMTQILSNRTHTLRRAAPDIRSSQSDLSKSNGLAVDWSKIPACQTVLIGDTSALRVFFF